MKFYQLNRKERLAQLLEAHQVTPAVFEQMLKDQPIPEEIANSMVENLLTEYSLPEGLVKDVLINGQQYQIPLVTEEPSVIAAANNASKLIGQQGGFDVKVQRQGVVGQIVLDHVEDIQQKVAFLRTKQVEIQKAADVAYPSIVKRGGGLRQQTVTIVGSDFLKLELLVDTQAAMGANIVNSICEAVAEQVEHWLHQEPLLAILSNYTPQNLTTVQVKIPVTALDKGTLQGITVAQRMVAATRFAQLDMQRAVTHNKGILNGVMGVVQAYGNDTRAISAGIHSYAARTGTYQPLSRWELVDQQLVGCLEIPLTVGTVGGSIGIVPMVKANQQLGQAMTPEKMQAQIATIGLASNFAALRALVTDGIQKGHMHLQYKSLAIQAGATGEDILWLQQQLSQMKTKNLVTAKALLAKKMTEKSD